MKLPVLLLGLAAAAAGCSSNGLAAPLPITAQPTVAPAGTPAAAVSSATPAAPHVAHGVPAVNTCTALSVTKGATRTVTGRGGVAIVFRNSGKSACVLSGYPGVVALDGSGANARTAERTRVGALGGLRFRLAAPVQLAAGAAASAYVEGSDTAAGGTAGCPVIGALRVTPPGSHAATTVHVTVPVCSTFVVHPVVTGVSGSDQG